jgi:hypothetical protein
MVFSQQNVLKAFGYSTEQVTDLNSYNILQHYLRVGEICQLNSLNEFLALYKKSNGLKFSNPLGFCVAQSNLNLCWKGCQFKQNQKAQAVSSIAESLSF